MMSIANQSSLDLEIADEGHVHGSRYFGAAWALVVAVGLFYSWNLGALPRRDMAANRDVGRGEVAPDLALYLEVIARVRRGENYYAVAGQAIPNYGFPTSSPLNWRLPTYAWLLSTLRCAGTIQLTLIALSIFALTIVFAVRWRQDGALCALLTTVAMIGVVRWAGDGYACVAQEPWAATLIVVSLAAHAASRHAVGWRYVSIVAGLAALFMRELALPYCAIAGLVAFSHGRRREAAYWLVGILAFFAFYAWHVSQVRGQLAVSGGSATTDVGQWLRLGGLDFVLLSSRMNGLLFEAPGAAIWLFLVAALLGSGVRRSDTSQLAGFAAAAYLVAFAFLGRPENFYWGLMPAPLLAWGFGSIAGWLPLEKQLQVEGCGP
jgi:hypothetical protein